MPPGGDSPLVGTDSLPTVRTTIAEVGDHLTGLDARTSSLERRSRRFSWYSWLFLFATFTSFLLYGVLANAFEVTTTTVSASGITVTVAVPWWVLDVSLSPALAFVVLAIREVVLGRRETGSPTGPVGVPGAGDPTGSPLNWTEVVQRCQKRVSHSKSEVEVAFVAWVLGLFTLAEFYASSVLVNDYPGLATSSILVGPIVGLCSLVLLWPLYRYAKRWVAADQTVLDRQVGELSRLEAEFLWRFAGAGAPG